MFRVTVGSLAAYLDFDPERKPDLVRLHALIREAAPALKRYFHKETPAGEAGMRMKMIGYGKFAARSGDAFVALERRIAVLRGSTLYTTGEPCVMCIGAILWCRVSRLVFAASVEQLATTRDQIMISSADIAAKAAFVPITITGGVLADEAMQLFGKK